MRLWVEILSFLSNYEVRYIKFLLDVLLASFYFFVYSSFFFFSVKALLHLFNKSPSNDYFFYFTLGIM